MKVLVVDDNPFIRLGLRAALEEMADVEEVGEAENGQVAVDLAADGHYDVVLLDVRMPVRDGLDALPDLVSQAAVLMLTHTDDMESVGEAMRDGAAGYIVHGALDPAGIATAIRACLAGGRVTFGLEPWATMPAPPSSNGARAKHDLSEREAEIMNLVARGLTNPQIARELFLSEKTVKNHINRIFARLAVTNRAQAIAVWLGTSPGPGGPEEKGPGLGPGQVVGRGPRP